MSKTKNEFLEKKMFYDIVFGICKKKSKIFGEFFMVYKKLENVKILQIFLTTKNNFKIKYTYERHLLRIRATCKPCEKNCTRTSQNKRAACGTRQFLSTAYLEYNVRPVASQFFL
jgi:hypothetical protein